ncbi:MAG: hypothetical protein U0694_26890 [Anaerolineae bacterium]
MNTSDDLFDRVSANMQRRKFWGRWGAFVVNLLCFLFALMLIVASVSDPASPAASIPIERREIFFVPMALWAFAILSQLASVIMDSGLMDKQMSSEALSKELGQELLEQKLRDMRQKRKNELGAVESDSMTVSDDGELVPLHDDETQRRAQRLG